MKRRDVIIVALLAVIVFVIFFKVGKSYFSPAPAPAPAPAPESTFTTAQVSKARELFNKGLKDIDVAVELVKTGVTPDDALKVIAQAKGSPAKIT